MLAAHLGCRCVCVCVCVRVSIRASGEFTIPCFQLAFHKLDEAVDFKLSHGKTLREKRRWASDDPRPTSACVLKLAFPYSCHAAPEESYVLWGLMSYSRRYWRKSLEPKRRSRNSAACTSIYAFSAHTEFFPMVRPSKRRFTKHSQRNQQRGKGLARDTRIPTCWVQQCPAVVA